MKQDSIDILIRTVLSTDGTGREISTWNVNSTINDSFQSLKYAAGFKPYGVTDKTSNVVYCRDSTLIARYYLLNDDPNQFNATFRIGFNNKQYIIDSIVPYPKHLEIYLELDI